MKNINCVWNDGPECKNFNMPRSWFGIGKRRCIECVPGKKCKLKISFPKPKTIPSAPPKIHGE